MKSFFRLTIKNKLIISFALILFVPSLLIGLISYNSAKGKVEDQILNAAGENVNLINQNIDLFFEDKVKVVNYLSKSFTSSQVESALVPRLVDFKKVYPEIQTVYLGTKSGALLSSSETKLAGNPEQKEWFQQAIEHSGNAVITDPSKDESTGDAIVTVAKTLEDNSGVVAFDVKIKTLADMVNEAKIGKEGYPQVLDKNSKFLIHPKQPVGADASNPEHKYMFKHDSGSTAYMLDGEEKKLMFETNKMTGWKISGTMYSAEIDKEARSILITTLIVIAASLVAAAALVYFIIKSIMTPLRRLMSATESINEGNLEETIEVNSHDELGQLGKSFNQMVDSLRSILGQVNISANTLIASSEELTATAEQSSQSAQQIASATQQIAAGADEQLNSVNGAATAINQMSAGIQQIAARSEEVAELTQNTLEVSKNGASSVADVIVHMNEIQQTVQDTSIIIRNLGDRSKEIVSIVSIITDISNQTNLLALNAAIESARAGEHGKGFAVVADEVRKLAEQSSASAKQISDLIGAIQVETDQAVNSMNAGTEKVADGVVRTQQFGELFQVIEQSVSNVSGKVQEVASSIYQMSAGSQQIVEAIDVVKQVAEEGASASQQNSATSEEQLATMEEVSSAAQSLSVLAEEMQTILAKFRL
ncbi:methyl-accepting chemotaxis protein [Peribacillus saganii]|uniref:Methyl-accepting chemotaxis protein n=1 Tax=Peribacillus saganii TaxID=2303992 RepID=A0A372LPG6_9BACI|nr:methyl-accepting chemotaxis protein [Peribacillus saganii]RFU69864.1 methyl-accepting chemotaxis protein [Peribacillus saganii]